MERFEGNGIMLGDAWYVVVATIGLFPNILLATFTNTLEMKM